MKKIAVTLAVLMGIAYSGAVLADGCFICADGGYVQYKGDDTFAKRKEAKEKFSCEVTGTTSSCSNPKGTVGEK